MAAMRPWHHPASATLAPARSPSRSTTGGYVVACIVASAVCRMLSTAGDQTGTLHAAMCAYVCSFQHPQDEVVLRTECAGDRSVRVRPPALGCRCSSCNNCSGRLLLTCCMLLPPGWCCPCKGRGFRGGVLPTGAHTVEVQEGQWQQRHMYADLIKTA